MQHPIERRASARESTREIKLCPVKNNRHLTLRGMQNYEIRRENRIMIIEIHIGDETIIIKVPP
jgi:hypothetical protein